MATTLRFKEHEEFHRAAIDMSIAGLLAGLVGHVGALVAPSIGPLWGPWSLAAIAGAAAFGACAPRFRVRVRELARIVGLAAAGGAALHLLSGRGAEPSLGVALFAVVFGMLLTTGQRDITRRKMILLVGTGAAVALVARFVLIRFVTAPELAGLPAWLTAAIAGAAFAGVGVIALLPRHVEIGRDRVEESFGACKDLTGEVRVLADRAHDVWVRVDGSLEADAPVRNAIEDSVLRLFDVARRWQRVESDGARTSTEALVERMSQLDAKIETVGDAIARGQYEQARAALAEQLGYLAEIGTSRERVVARMHHYLAAMERLRFAVINHRSADASRLSTEVQPILDDLKDLGKEIDCTSEALGECERANSAN